MLVLGHRDGLALPLRHFHRDQLCLEKATGIGGGRALLAAKRQLVLILTAHGELGGDVLAGLGHGVHAVLGAQLRIDEAPADGGIEDFGLAAERGIRLGHDERSAGHGLHASRKRQVRLARLDRPGSDGYCLQPGGAEPIDCNARHVHGQTGQQGGHARDIAIVFPRLVRAAEHDLIDSLWIE